MHPSFKDKTKAQTEKPHEKRPAALENEESCVEGGRTVVCLGSTTVRPSPRSVMITTGQPWWPLAAMVPSLLERCVWVRWTRLGSLVLDLLGLSWYSLDLVGLNFLLFS